MSRARKLLGPHLSKTSKKTKKAQNDPQKEKNKKSNITNVLWGRGTKYKPWRKIVFQIKKQSV